MKNDITFAWKHIFILADSPTSGEVAQHGLFRGGHWSLLHILAANAGIETEIKLATKKYITYQPITEQEYKNSTLKKGKLPTDVYTKAGWFSAKRAAQLAEFQKWFTNLPEFSLCLCVGTIAWKLISGLDSLYKWRGSWASFSCGRIWILPSLPLAETLANYTQSSLMESDISRFAWAIRNNKIPAAPAFKWQLLDKVEEVLSTLETVVFTKPKVAIDIEVFRNTISSIALSVGENENFVIPFNQKLPKLDKVEEVFIKKDKIKIILHLRQLFNTTLPDGSKRTLIFQNSPFDMEFLYKEFLCFPHSCVDIMDTMGMAHVLSNMQKRALHILASLHLHNYRYWKDDKKGDEDSSKGLMFAGCTELWQYNAQDAWHTLQLYDILKEKLEKQNLLNIAIFQCSTLLPALFRISFTGIKRDIDLIAKYNAKLNVHRTRSENYLVKASAGLLTKDSPKSPKQLQTFFYTRLKVPPQLHKKTKKPTTDEEALDNIGKQFPFFSPICKAINHIRGLNTAEAALNITPSIFGRGTTQYSPFVTDTYRLASKTNGYGEGQNQQNITKGVEQNSEQNYKQWRPNLRNIHIPDSDFVWFEGDLERADLQVVVWESDDKDLKDKLRAKIDLHKANAMDIFKISSMDKVSDEKRQLAKLGVHAVNYDVQPKTLAASLGILVKEAELFIKRWKEAHPQIAQWQEETKAIFQQSGELINIFGYKLKWLGRIDYHALHACLAWKPQSTISVVTNTILIRYDQQLVGKYFNLLGQGHDSLNWQIHKDKIGNYKQQMIDLAKVSIPYVDPLIIPFDIKRKVGSWGSENEKA